MYIIPFDSIRFHSIPLCCVVFPILKMRFTLILIVALTGGCYLKNSSKSFILYTPPIFHFIPHQDFQHSITTNTAQSVVR